MVWPQKISDGNIMQTFVNKKKLIIGAFYRSFVSDRCWLFLEHCCIIKKKSSYILYLASFSYWFDSLLTVFTKSNKTEILGKSHEFCVYGSFLFCLNWFKYQGYIALKVRRKEMFFLRKKSETIWVNLTWPMRDLFPLVDVGGNTIQLFVFFFLFTYFLNICCLHWLEIQPLKSYRSKIELSLSAERLIAEL